MVTVLIDCLTVLLEYIDLVYLSHRAYQTFRKAVYMNWMGNAHPGMTLALPLIQNKNNFYWSM